MRIQAARSDQLEDMRAISVKVQGRDILLVRTNGAVFALDDKCPHADQSLATGSVKDATITCRHHGVQIDLASGRILWSMGFLDLPPVASFPVTEEDGLIWVDLAY